MKMEKYYIFQENGQRKCRNRFATETPPEGCEVFCGGIPRHLREPELLVLFETIGPIHELRLMMDFSGTNRGFAFVSFTRPEDAQNAVRVLNNHEILPNRMIGVHISKDNRTLFFGGIPPNVSPHEIFLHVSRVTPNLVDVRACFRSKFSYALLVYDTHRSASIARRQLLNGDFFDRRVTIDWSREQKTHDSTSRRR